jgi:hypothetical protein
MHRCAIAQAFIWRHEQANIRHVFCLPPFNPADPREILFYPGTKSTEFAVILFGGQIIPEQGRYFCVLRACRRDVQRLYEGADIIIIY